jgi:hypothetical protein
MGNRRLTAAAGTLCAVLLLTGCASGGSGHSAAPGGSVSGTPSGPATGSPAPGSPDSPSPLPSGLSLPPSARPAPTGTQTLTGDVEAGVEHGCLILHDSGRTYQLIGGDPAVVHAGARVRVTGRVATGIKSFCMQGLPFQVVEAHSI